VGKSLQKDHITKMRVGLNRFDPRNDLVLSCVRIGMDCMNLVTVISRYTQVPVTLIKVISIHVPLLWTSQTHYSLFYKLLAWQWAS